MTREINGPNCISGGLGDFRVVVLGEWTQFGHNSWIPNAPENIDDHRKILAFVKCLLKERLGPLPSLDEEHSGYGTNVLVVGVESVDQRTASRIKTRYVPDRFRHEQLCYFCEIRNQHLFSRLAKTLPYILIAECIRASPSLRAYSVFYTFAKYMDRGLPNG